MRILEKIKNSYFKIWIKNQIINLAEEIPNNFPLKICLDANSVIGVNKHLAILTIEDLNKRNKNNFENFFSSYILDPITPKINTANQNSSSSLQELKINFFIKNGITNIKNSSIESLKKLTTEIINFQNLKRETLTIEESIKDIKPPQLRPDFYISPYF